jgi:hypothetical protein
MREIFDLRAREANRDAPGEHRNGCWHGAALAHRILHRHCRRGVLGPRQPVRDERRLERDDRPLLV